MVFTFDSSILQVLVHFLIIFVGHSYGLCFSGIIKAAPKLPAHLGKNMEEVVSLRCLEELCGPRNGSMNSTWSSLGSKAKIDTSKSCSEMMQLKRVP